MDSETMNLRMMITGISLNSYQRSLALQEYNHLHAKANYWERRCELAEKCIEESPCDPDITSGQIKAHNEWTNFKQTKP